MTSRDFFFKGASKGGENDEFRHLEFQRPETNQVEMSKTEIGNAEKIGRKLILEIQITCISKDFLLGRIRMWTVIEAMGLNEKVHMRKATSKE